LTAPRGGSGEQQKATTDLPNRLNREAMPADEADTELSARIAAYELAYRMQSHAQEVVDVKGESEATRKLYGLDDRVTQEFGLRCLLARRMVERGVRF